MRNCIIQSAISFLKNGIIAKNNNVIKTSTVNINNIKNISSDLSEKKKRGRPPKNTSFQSEETTTTAAVKGKIIIQ